MKTSFTRAGKLKLVLFITLCAVLLGCAVLLCFDIYNKNSDTPSDMPQLTQISAPEHEAKATATATVQIPSFTSIYSTDGVTWSGTMAFFTWRAGTTTVNFGFYHIEHVILSSSSTGVSLGAYEKAGGPIQVNPANVGTYYFTAKPESGYVFSNGATSIEYTIIIRSNNPTKIAIPSFSSTYSDKGVTFSGTTASYTFDNNYQSPTRVNFDFARNGDGSTNRSGFFLSSSSTGVYISGAYEHSGPIQVDAKAGTYYFTATTTAAYAFSDGSTSVTYTIQIKTACIVSYATIATVDDQTYKGSAITPTPKVTYNNTTLVNGTDFTFDYEKNTNVGTATIKITGKGNYIGTKTATFKIIPRNISNVSFGTIETQTYDKGAFLAPTPEISDINISKTLIENTDFTYGYKNNVNAGTATITVTGMGNYTGTKSTTFAVNARDISLATIGEINDFTYDGEAKTPSATVTDGEITLSSTADFTFSYTNNIKAGTATLTITGTGNYTGKLSKEFTIAPREISLVSVEEITAKTYTGSAITPSPTVTDLSKTLAKDADYTLSYINNTNVGTAMITLTGTGNYSGTKEVTFSITKRNISNVTVAAIETCYYDGAEKTPTPEVTDGDLTLVEGTDFEYSYRDNINAGTATLVLTGIGNYGGTKEVAFTIIKTTIEEATVTLSQTEFTYDGTAKEPQVTLVQIGDLTIAEGVDFTVSYSANVNAGTAKVILTGTGDYTGTKEVTFTINLVNISSATLVGLELTYVYTGSAIIPALTVNLDGKELVKNTDYLIVFTDNEAVGTATVTVTGSKNYSGELTDTFEVVKANITSVTVMGINETYQYTGSAITPEPSVIFNGIALVKDADYTLSYSANTALGAATVAVTGLGNFEGTAIKTFEIVKAKPVVTVTYPDYDKDNDTLYAGKSLPEITATASFNGVNVAGTIEWKQEDGAAPTLKNGERAYGWVFTPDDTDNYEVIEGSETLTAQIPSYTTISAEWKNGAQPVLFTSSSVSVIKQNLKVMGIFDSSDRDEISGGYSFVGSWDDTGAANTVKMPSRGGNDFFITVYFGELNSVILSVEIKDVVLTEIIADATVTDYTALDKFDTSSVTATAKYNDGAEKSLSFGKGGYTVIYEQGDFLQFGDTKVTFSYTENGVTKTAEVEVSVSEKVEPKVTPTVGGGASAGTKLSEISFHVGDGTTAGTLTWDDADYELKEGPNRCWYTFTPDDTKNFKVLHGYVDIEVEAPKAADTSGGLIGWQIILIIVAAIVAFIAIVALALALKLRRAADTDGFYDDATEEQLTA